jgi:hypothetical protein
MAQTTIPPDPEETPLVYLRTIRTILENHTRSFADVIDRLSRLEREAAATRRDIAHLHEDWVGMSGRLDRLDQRLTRIERRLDLVDAPTPGTPTGTL